MALLESSTAAKEIAFVFMNIVLDLEIFTDFSEGITMKTPYQFFSGVINTLIIVWNDPYLDI